MNKKYIVKPLFIFALIYLAQYLSFFDKLEIWYAQMDINFELIIASIVTPIFLFFLALSISVFIKFIRLKPQNIKKVTIELNVLTKGKDTGVSALKDLISSSFTLDQLKELSLEKFKRVQIDGQTYVISVKNVVFHSYNSVKPIKLRLRFLVERKFESSKLNTLLLGKPLNWEVTNVKSL